MDHAHPSSGKMEVSKCAVSPTLRFSKSDAITSTNVKDGQHVLEPLIPGYSFTPVSASILTSSPSDRQVLTKLAASCDCLRFHHPCSELPSRTTIITHLNSISSSPDPASSCSKGELFHPTPRDEPAWDAQEPDGADDALLSAYDAWHAQDHGTRSHSVSHYENAE